ncbi:MAG: hypothetical protein JNM93_07555 [Bacteriovoracaceae bacterium]|nr:hypothetical protein [Bacteriovoracaceae bacterium]
MRKLLVGLLALGSVSAFAGGYGQDLRPGHYTSPDDLDRISNGFYDNLIDSSCSTGYLNTSTFKLNIAMGAQLIGLKVEPKSENGRAFLYIWPQFNIEPPSGRNVAGKCFVTKF